VHWIRVLLFGLLALDVVQLGVAALAVAHGRRRRARGESVLARYSFSHAAELAAGSVALGIPVVLGLTRAIGAGAALAAVIAVELVTAVVARVVLERLARAARAGLPGAAASTSAAAASAASE
jgi:hypothetical protein